MDLYQSLQDGFKPSSRKKGIGTFMVLLALLIIIAGVIKPSFFPVLDVVYGLFLLLLGVITIIWGRGYRFFVNMYVWVNKDGFELKVERRPCKVQWSQIEKIIFRPEVIAIRLYDDDPIDVPLDHLNPNCVIFLQQIFSEATWEKEVPISFS